MTAAERKVAVKHTDITEETPQERTTLYLERLMKRVSLKNENTKKYQTQISRWTSLTSASSCLKAMNKFCEDSKAGRYVDQKKALDEILFSMKTYQRNLDIQRNGCYSLNFITEATDKIAISSADKEEIASVLISALENHAKDYSILIFGSKGLYDFGKRCQLMFRLEQLVPRLLKCVKFADGWYCYFACFLMSNIANFVGEEVKEMIGKLGAIQTLLCAIKYRRNSDYYEGISEACWSLFTSLTDVTPANCDLFIQCEGLPILLECISQHAHGVEKVTISSWITFSNISEVKRLRIHMMNHATVKFLLNHLDPAITSNEISLLVAQILVNLLSDGENAWTVSSPHRSSVIYKIVETMLQWDLDSPLHFVSSSLEFLWGLIDCAHTPVCQYYALWVLAKLTRLERGRYCSMIEEEEGMKHLQKLLTSSSQTLTIMSGSHKTKTAGQLATSIFKLAMKVINTFKDHTQYAGYKSQNWRVLTMLFEAAVSGNLQDMEDLINANADLNMKCPIKGFEGRTAIHLATENGHTDMVCKMIQHHAYPHITDAEGMTGLHIAAWNGHLDLVKVFIYYGADPYAEAKGKGWKAVHFSAASGHLQILKFFKDKCDLKVKTRDRKTVLQLAEENGHQKVIRWLKGYGF